MASITLSNAVAFELDAAATLLNVSLRTIQRRRAANEAAVVADIEKALRARGIVQVTTAAPALASGIAGKDARNCAMALEQGRAKAPKAPKAVTEPKAPKAPKATATEAKGIINRAGRVVLKGNAPVRAAIKAAIQSLGASRAEVSGFTSYSDFLNGFEFKATAGVGEKARMVLIVHPVGIEAEKGKPSPVAEFIINADGTYKVA